MQQPQGRDASRDPSHPAALILGLQLKLLHARPDERPFILVNDLFRLVPYRQAVFYDAAKGTPTAFSGVSTPDPNAAYPLWVKDLAKRRLNTTPPPTGPLLLDFAKDDPAPEALWREHVPAHGLCLPLPGPYGLIPGALLLFREQPFTEPELAALSVAAENAGTVLALAEADFAGLKKRLAPTGKRRRALLVCAAILAVLLIPLRQNALAPAEVAPRNPLVVRAAVDGVIAQIFVKPNQMVAEGEALFAVDEAQLAGRLAAAEKSLEAVETEYQLTAQSALFDPKAKARTPVLKAQSESRKAEVDHLRTLLGRATVTATRPGVAVFDDPHDWIGRPVTIGQRVMLLADPADLLLEIRLPSQELFVVEPGAQALFFPLVAPASPVAARVEHIAYQATQTPDGYAFTLRAGFSDPSDAIRLGRRGAAKIHGARAPLLVQILRKPLYVARQWIGL